MARISHYTTVTRFGSRPIMGKAEVMARIGHLPRKPFRFGEGQEWWPVFKGGA